MGAPAVASPALRRADGKPAWRPDAASASCLCCGQQFSMFVRRHHCRACGELVCAACSPHLGALPELGYADPVRVCSRCHKPGDSLESQTQAQAQLLLLSESSSDGEDEVEEEVVFRAVEVIALHSRDKRDKLMYQYFLKSEAVNWLADAGLARNRSRCAALFGRVVAAGYVTLKPAVNGAASASARAAFFILSDEVCLDRVSQYGTAIHSDTVKCSNCARAYLKSMTSTPGFCSIDCKTNAIISQADSAKIRRYYTS